MSVRPHPDPRIRWASDAQALAYRVRTGCIVAAEVGEIFAGAFAFAPDDERPLRATTVFALDLARNPEAAGTGLIDFVLLWLEDASPEITTALHTWQERADCGL